MVGVFCGESGGSWSVMITVRVAKVFLPPYVLVIIVICCLRDQVRPSTERWVQRPREGRVRDTWGPRFQSGGKLRSAWGYVVSGRCNCRGGGTVGEYNCKLGWRELK